ncbi:MAG: RHS repeat-associated core domain-containing protein [Chitinophagales bacterium]|nr:RHS repeat-associated core domain-containing protein [Chitinophagales bacterium]
MTPDNNKLYNGKELNRDFDVNLYEYGARWYDPALGRWTSIDPLAEGYYPYSPYNYVLNNPIGNTDPDGRSVDGDFFEVHNGKVYHVGSDGVDDGKSYVVRDRGAFSNARRGGLNASATASLVESGAAAELSVVLPEGASSEGQALENLYNDGVATVTEGNPGGNEQAVQFIMNAADATITLSRVESEGTKNKLPRSGPGHVQLDTPGEIQQKFGPNAASFGDAHTHQAENYASPQESAQLNSQAGDGKNARRNGTTTFSMGSLGSTIQHSRKGSSVLAPNQQVFNGNISLIKTALNNLKR